MVVGDRQRFHRAFAAALERYLQAQGKTQAQVAAAIVQRQFTSRTSQVQDRPRRVTAWEKRLSDWKRGKSLPRDESDLLLAMGVIAAGTVRSDWRQLWRDAREDRSRGVPDGRSAPARSGQASPGPKPRTRPPTASGYGNLVTIRHANTGVTVSGPGSHAAHEDAAHATVVEADTAGKDGRGPTLRSEEPMALSVALDHWSYDDGTRAPNALRELGDNGMVSHPGFDARRHAGLADPPMVRLATVIAGDVLRPGRLKTSRMRSSLNEMLSVVTPAVIAPLTALRPETRWQARSGFGGSSVLEAVLTGDDEQEPPLATARLILATDTTTLLDTPRYSRLVISVEPRAGSGSAAPPIPLTRWPAHFLTGLTVLPTALHGLLTNDYGLTVHAELAPAFGVWLKPQQSLLELIDIAGFTALPGVGPMPWFTTFAIADATAGPAVDAVDLMTTQLCDYGLHLEEYDELLFSTAPDVQPHVPTPATDARAVPRIVTRPSTLPSAEEDPGWHRRTDRLRANFEALVTFTRELEQVSREQGFLFAGEDLAQRDERHRQMLELVEPPAEAAHRALRIEPDVEDVVAAYEQARGAGGRLLSFHRTLIEHPGPGNPEEIRKLSDALQAAVTELEATTRDRLRVLYTGPSGAT